MRVITIVLTLTLAALAGCSTEPSVHVPPDAPTPLCADVPACHDQLCRIDPSGDPAYCDCGGVRCLKGQGFDDGLASRSDGSVIESDHSNESEIP